jgi:hypothetical protein
MEHFTWAGLFHIHEAYGAVYGDGREVQRIYHEHFPKSVCQDYSMFASVDRCLGKTDTFAMNRHTTG